MGSGTVFLVPRFLLAGTLGVGLGSIAPEPMPFEALISRRVNCPFLSDRLN
jgi:hypothetical protein